MKKKLILLYLFLTLLPLTHLKALSASDGFFNNLDSAAANNYSAVQADKTFLESAVGRAIGFGLGFLGIIFLISILWSGFQWMTSGGNGEVIKKAKARMINAAIGLAIILASYIITYYVYDFLITNSGGGSGTPGGNTPPIN